jgi:hypothetical protein
MPNFTHFCPYEELPRIGKMAKDLAVGVKADYPTVCVRAAGRYYKDGRIIPV